MATNQKKFVVLFVYGLKIDKLNLFLFHFRTKFHLIWSTFVVLIVIYKVFSQGTLEN